MKINDEQKKLTREYVDLNELLLFLDKDMQRAGLDVVEIKGVQTMRYEVMRRLTELRKMFLTAFGVVTGNVENSNITLTSAEITERIKEI